MADRPGAGHDGTSETQTSAILDAAALAIAALLTESGFALAAPVAAAFYTATYGTTGVEVTVRLDDPAAATEARALLLERFGSADGVDVFDVG